MSVSVENTSHLGRKLNAKIPNQELQNLLKERMVKLSKEVRLKGFRPGKVPINVIQKQFGPSVRQEVISELIEKTLKDALTENDFKIAGRPVIDSIQDEKEQDLSFSATFEVFPDIKLSDLSEVEIERKVVEVTEADIDKMVDKLSKNLGQWNSVDKVGANGDRLKVDFKRQLAGEDEETQDGVTLEIGHDSVLPGLSDKLVGAQKGDTIETEVTYPEQWGEEKAKGKNAKLTVIVNDVTENQPLDEAALAEKLGMKDKDSAKLRDKIKERMQDEVKRTLNQAIQEDVLEILLDKNQFELPQSLIEQEIKAIDEEHKRQLQQQPNLQPMPEDERQSSAEKRVKLGLIINEIIGKYKIKVDGQLLRKEVEYLAQEFGNPEEIINLYFSNQQLLSGVERVVLLQQSIEALLKDMKTKEKSVTFDEVMNPKQQG